MEQVLRIPEVVRTICSNLNTASNRRMALTCRSFLEPALDELWRTLRSFQSLVDVLPSDLWTVDLLPPPDPAVSDMELRVLVRCWITPSLRAKCKCRSSSIQPAS
jgi:hypothetical protein